jgi:dTDP-4-amino-4,6-dideoxygalactose transaminase
MQAAMLRVKLQYLDTETKRRKEIALAYAKDIIHPALSQPITAHSTLTSLENHIFHLYVVRTAEREALQAHLANTGIQTLIHYPIPPHQQQAYPQWNEKSYPLTEAVHQQVLSLPISPVMTDDQVDAVIAACNSFETP